ncbi:MAG TPA: hypothetical protein VMK65_12570 [Longimicrobiales bacterium]|nr:hypothetical protein [Longimicrobiales bacterium]
MNNVDLLVSGVADLGVEAFRLLAALVTGFTVLLGVALFACGMAVTIAEMVASVREARREEASGAHVERARTRG